MGKTHALVSMLRWSGLQPLWRQCLRLILKSLRSSNVHAWERIYRASLMRLGYCASNDTNANGEFQTVRFVARHAPPSVVLDVGANTGDYTAMVLKAMPGVSIHALEPAATCFRRIQERFAGEPRVCTHGIGLGAETCSATLYSNEEGSEIASVYNRQLDFMGIAMVPSETIQMESLDEFCESNGIKSISLLKLDVEGHEMAVLKGAVNMIDRVHAIQFEFGGCNVDSRVFFRDFWNLLHDRFHIHRIASWGLVHVPSYWEGCEVFLKCNYLATAKSTFSLLRADVTFDNELGMGTAVMPG